MNIGVSSCLIGNLCRYDGEQNRDEFLTNSLSKYAKFIAFCPENEVFGTPREPIMITKENRILRVVTRETSRDVTQPLEEICTKMVNSFDEYNLCGFVLKSKSPSCGMEKVKRFNMRLDKFEEKGIGVFAKEIVEKYPHLPTIEEKDLLDNWLRESFLIDIFAYQNMIKFIESVIEFSELEEYHINYKYLIYSKCPDTYKRMGRILTDYPKKSFQEVLDEYKNEFFRAISIKATIYSTNNLLMHIYTYFKKEINREEKIEVIESIKDFKAGNRSLMSVIEVLMEYIDKFSIKSLQKQCFFNPYPKELL